MANHKLSNYPVELGAGTAAAPSLHFGDDTTGFYRSAENEVAVSIEETNVLTVSAGVVVASVPVLSSSIIGVVTTGEDANLGSTATGDANTAAVNLQKANDGGAATVDADNLGNIVFNGTNGDGDPVVAAQISAYQKGAQDTECPGGLVISLSSDTDPLVQNLAMESDKIGFLGATPSTQIEITGNLATGASTADILGVVRQVVDLLEAFGLALDSTTRD